MKTRITEKQRTFEFGKIDYYGTGRRINAVTVRVTLYGDGSNESPYELSVCGEIWNARRSDIVSGGQNLYEISKYITGNPLFDEIYDLWEKYHLNGINAGTHRQTAALIAETERRNAEHHKNGEKDEEPLTYASRFYDACDYLKSINLFIDTLGEGELLRDETEEVRHDHYPYGHGWVAYVLDKKAIERIKSLLERGEVLA